MEALAEYGKNAATKKMAGSTTGRTFAATLPRVAAPKPHREDNIDGISLTVIGRYCTGGLQNLRTLAISSSSLQGLMIISLAPYFNAFNTAVLVQRWALMII